MQSANPYFEKQAEWLERRRIEHGLLAADGTLDTGRKLACSFYEVLTLDYYRQNLSLLQGIPEASYQTDEEYRESLVLHTQRFIKALDRGDDRPDAGFFCDKSARPVAWLLLETWPLFRGDPRQPLPEIRFLNIDANQVFARHGDSRPTDEEIYGWEPTREQVEDIRRIYSRVRPGPRHPACWRRTWIIDEIAVSGGTLLMGKSLLQAAFPGMSVEGKVWMAVGKVQSGRRGAEAYLPAQLAPWYSKHFPQGKGVGGLGFNRFLSTRGEKDVLSEALRTDIRLLGADIVRARQSVRPIIGCCEKDPVTGEQDLSRPKYKIARFVGGRRVVKMPP